MFSQDIVNSARRTLRDEFAQSRAHSDPAFIDYINRGVMFIANADSSASVKTTAIPLVVGSIQKLPTGGIRILKILHNNLGANVRKLVGARRYNGQHAVKEIPLSTLQAQIPNWSGERESSIAVITCFNEDDPTSFINFPPNDGVGSLMITWSFLPTAITAISSVATGDIGLPSKFFNILLNFTMALCLMRDGESSINGRRGQAMMQAVASEMGVKSLADTADTPADTVKG